VSGIKGAGVEVSAEAKGSEKYSTILTSQEADPRARRPAAAKRRKADGLSCFQFLLQALVGTLENSPPQARAVLIVGNTSSSS